jgi:[ribosomal protein S18]-alanine N-acetyltransferase
MNAQLKPASAHIRPLRESDVVRAMEIERKAYPFPWSEAIFRDCFKSGYSGLALEQSGVLLGYGWISCAAGEAHIMNVAVEPDLQGLGHGKHLLKRLIDVARWYRAERVLLEVRRSNVVAISLYHHMGFNEIGQRPNYYPAQGKREDALIYAMELHSPWLAALALQETGLP